MARLPDEVRESLEAFIVECLLPTKPTPYSKDQKRLTSAEIYPIYLKYCEYGLMTPVHIKTLGKKLSERFLWVKNNKNNKFYCEINPTILRKAGEV